MENNNLKEVKEINQDFESSPVPLDSRKTFWGITIVWLGFVFVITSMITGGGLEF